jgi:hypothetical protein
MTPIIQVTPRKIALVIGINYYGSSCELRGCIEDAKNICQFLKTVAGYPEHNMIVMTDIKHQIPSLIPTKQNIINKLNYLLSVASQYDEMWISYSGHGTQVEDLQNDESDQQDEALCPVDHRINGFIIDDYLLNEFILKLPLNITLISLMDCCHSGTILDLPYLYKNNFKCINKDFTKAVERKFKRLRELQKKQKEVVVENPYDLNFTFPSVVCISGCRDDQTSADAFIDNKFAGAMTWSFLKCLKEVNYNIPCSKLIDRMDQLLLSEHYVQVPTLTLSKKDDGERLFIDSSLITKIADMETIPTSHPSFVDHTMIPLNSPLNNPLFQIQNLQSSSSIVSSPESPRPSTQNASHSNASNPESPRPPIATTSSFTHTDSINIIPQTDSMIMKKYKLVKIEITTPATLECLNNYWNLFLTRHSMSMYKENQNIKQSTVKSLQLTEGNYKLIFNVKDTQRVQVKLFIDDLHITSVFEGTYHEIIFDV